MTFDKLQRDELTPTRKLQSQMKNIRAMTRDRFKFTFSLIFQIIVNLPLPNNFFWLVPPVRSVTQYSILNKT